MAHDFAKLKTLHDLYIATRDRDAWWAMYQEALIGIVPIYRSYVRSSGVFARDHHDNCEAIVYRLLERFLRIEQYRVSNWVSALYLEIKFFFANRPRESGLAHDIEAPASMQVEESNPIDTLLSDHEIEAKKIVVDLYQAIYYRRAVKKISSYTPRQKIYEYAVELKHIFDQTRRPKNGKRRPKKTTTWARARAIIDNVTRKTRRRTQIDVPGGGNSRESGDSGAGPKPD